MLTFNVLGDCVSRDILQPFVEQNEIRVLQYSSYSSPISMCSAAPNFKIKMEDLVDHTGSTFERRCLVNDINKYTLDYVFEKKSDYIIFDILDARAQLLCNENIYITILNHVIKNRSKLNKKFGFDVYTEVSPFDISDEKWNECIDVICKRLLQNYDPNQIIINRHFGIPCFYENGSIKDFTPPH